tara:strand:+ start:2986 stop:3588 length:603 start_codon:yes stop_codon:yes gene_type:complete
MLIRSGNAKRDVLAIADDIINQSDSLFGLLKWDASDFQRIQGIGKIKALQLSTQIEIAKRMMQSKRSSQIFLDEAQKVWDYLYPEVRADTVEKVWVLCLDRKNKLIRAEPITSGTASGSLVHPREVFRPAIRHGASAIILAHNHPSGDPTPSSADLKVTKKILEASKAVDLSMLDHVIIGEPDSCPQSQGFYSFSDGGLL